MRIGIARIVAAAGFAGLLTAGIAGPAQADPEAQVAAAPCAAIAGPPIVVPGDFLAARSDTRSAGHYELAGTALHVYTDDSTGQAKVAEYMAVATTPLGSAGEPALDWTGSATPPGFQLGVDLDADGTPDGILVGEPKYYGNRWWANNTLQTWITSHGGTPAGLVSGGGDGSPVAGPLSTWATAYPSATVRYIGFSLGSGVKGDGTIASLTFACATSTFAAAPPPAPRTPIEFTQTETFGAMAPGGQATASYLISSGPNGEPADDGAVIIGIDDVTAVELASCTVIVDGGPAAPAVIEYDPTLDGVTYSGALIYVAGGLVLDPGTALPIDVACQTTASASAGTYALTAAFTYGNQAPATVAAQVLVAPGQVGTLDDALTITAAPAVATTAPVTPAPTTSSAVLAATGPTQAAGALRLGLLALAGGLVLASAGAVRRTGSARRAH